MISKSDTMAIVSCAAKFDVSKVLLFGSSAKENTEAADIDLAVAGIRPERFFEFYAELIKDLSRPVDLVDLSHRSLFTEMVEQEGVRLYG